MGEAQSSLEQLSKNCSRWSLQLTFFLSFLGEAEKWWLASSKASLESDDVEHQLEDRLSTAGGRQARQCVVLCSSHSGR